MPLPIANSPLLKAVVPPSTPSTAKPWEQAVVSVVNGTAGMTRNLLQPIVRATDPLPSVTPPVPQAIKPDSQDSIWSTVSKHLTRTTGQNEQIIRDRQAINPSAVKPPVVTQRSPWVQNLNKAARGIVTSADQVDARTAPDVAPVLKPAVVALENAPQLLTSGPGAKAKAVNLIGGAVLDYGAGSSVAGAASKTLTPGNSLLSNISQTILTPALQSLGF